MQKNNWARERQSIRCWPTFFLASRHWLHFKRLSFFPLVLPSFPSSEPPLSLSGMTSVRFDNTKSTRGWGRCVSEVCGVAEAFSERSGSMAISAMFWCAVKSYAIYGCGRRWAFGVSGSRRSRRCEARNCKRRCRAGWLLERHYVYTVLEQDFWNPDIFIILPTMRHWTHLLILM